MAILVAWAVVGLARSVPEDRAKPFVARVIGVGPGLTVTVDFSPVTGAASQWRLAGLVTDQPRPAQRLLRRRLLNQRVRVVPRSETEALIVWPSDDDEKPDPVASLLEEGLARPITDLP